MKRFLAAIAATVYLALMPSVVSAQVFSQNQIIIPPFGNGVIVSTSTGTGRKLEASSSPNVASIFATSTSATSTIAQLAVGALSGFLKATAGYIGAALVNLASDVTGVLPYGNGGTGTTTAPVSQ